MPSRPVNYILEGWPLVAKRSLVAYQNGPPGRYSVISLWCPAVHFSFKARTSDVWRTWFSWQTTFGRCWFHFYWPHRTIEPEKICFSRYLLQEINKSRRSIRMQIITTDWLTLNIRLFCSYYRVCLYPFWKETGESNDLRKIDVWPTMGRILPVSWKVGQYVPRSRL